jgi:1-aminocyclopropane-1-carboxylate deaminase/D-cysteine desulfhydrase-like pyridoxal-dependent ACC family enzyme
MHLEQLPRYPLAQLPTPIQTLPELTRVFGGPELLLKSDGRTGFEVRGMVVRGIETGRIHSSAPPWNPVGGPVSA